MAVMTGGILGKVTGKIGNVVSSNWKNKNVVKSFTKPANPDTEAQQTQRSKFAECVNFAKLILVSIIQKFWDVQAVGMSGFNLFTRTNIDSFDDPIVYSTVKVSQGQLEGSAITSAEYAATDVDFVFPSSVVGNGLSSDKVVAVVVDIVNNVAFVNDSTVTRTDGAISVTVGAGRTIANLRAWLVFYRGSGKTLINSTSSYSVVS